MFQDIFLLSVLPRRHELVFSVNQNLALVRYSDLSTQEFGERLHFLAKGNADFIGRDFPHVVAKRYATRALAIRSVRQLAWSPAPNLHAFAITRNDTVIGAATIWQQSACSGVWPVRRQVLRGSQFAFWTGNAIHRLGAPWPLAPVLLPLIVERAKATRMPGPIWTLVRPERKRLREALEVVGLEMIGKPRRYGIGDGMRARRCLYASSAGSQSD